MVARPRRSVLYIPGSNPKALAKARELPADAIILDLEDSVAPDAKIEARDRVVATLKAGGYGGREMLIRVNGVHTPWGEADLEAAAAAAPDGVLLPKVDGPGTVMHAARILRAAPENTRLWAMMETPHAMLNAASIASIAADPASRLEALVLGLNDYAKETRARFAPGRAAFQPWLATCVAAARAHGCDIIDGVYNDIKDLAGFAAECRLDPAQASNVSLVPDANFVFIHDGQPSCDVDVLKIEQRSSNCLTDRLLCGRMHLQPNHAESLLGWESHDVREISIQRYEYTTVLNSETQDLFVGRSR